MGRLAVPRVGSAAAAAVAAPRELHLACSAAVAAAGEIAVAGKTAGQAVAGVAAAAAVVVAAAGSKEGSLEADLCLNFPATSMAVTGCSGCSV